MSSKIVNAYAEAALQVAAAEDSLSAVESELSALAHAVDGNDDLRTALTDAGLPAEKRQQIVADVLGGQASKATHAIAAMIVGAGRGGDLTAIAQAVGQRGSASRGSARAEVRSAVPLSDDQVSRLAAALSQSTGQDIEVSVIVDKSVVGGLVTQIGDTVIDGSVRRRLSQMKASLAGS